jgi:hypothetical protein
VQRRERISLRAYFDLARAAQPIAPAPRRRPAKHRIRPSVQQVLDALSGAAAHIGNDRLDILGATRSGTTNASRSSSTPA